MIGWFSEGFPEPSGYDLLTHVSGRPVRVAGYPAKIDVTPSTDSCLADGGTNLITATVATGPGADNLAMRACLAHPSRQLVDRVLASLRSLRVRSGASAPGIVVGQYRMSGGPAPGLNRPVPGTIWAYPGRLTLADIKTATASIHVNTDAVGRFRLSLSPGEYTILGALGLSRSVQRRGCGAPTSVDVRAAIVHRLTLWCSVP